MKTVHEIIDEFYPTINHVELGELYCRDKVVLIVRDYMAQFEQTNANTVLCGEGVKEIHPIPHAADVNEAAKLFAQNNPPNEPLKSEGMKKGVSDGCENHVTIRDGEFDYCMACGKQVNRV